jgi:uncharacterized protein YjbI with pentapeptide repeats
MPRAVLSWTHGNHTNFAGADLRGASDHADEAGASQRASRLRDSNFTDAWTSENTHIGHVNLQLRDKHSGDHPLAARCSD